MTDNSTPREEDKGNDAACYKESSFTPIPNKSFKKLRKKQKELLKRIQVAADR